MGTPKKAYEQEWYERLKLVVERVEHHEHERSLGSEPTILEETAAEVRPELVTGR
jgi:hypothetical protein